MKFLVSLIPFLLFVISCDEKKDVFDYNSFPEHWVKLTEKNGNLVVFNSCDAGNMLLTFSKYTDRFELLLHGEQEDYNFEILETRHHSDTTYFKAKWKNTEEKQDFKFIWIDKEKGLGRFITLYSSGFTSDNLFVTSEKQTNFQKIDQPCKECWGDECDELENKQEFEMDKLNSGEHKE
jgi:hypothetical protein